MAFYRTKRVNGKEYRQLVENYREGGKVRQRVLAHLGHYETVSEAVEYFERFAAKQRELEAKVREKLDHDLPARIEAHRQYCRERYEETYKETRREMLRAIADGEAEAPRFAGERRELEGKMAEHSKAAARYEAKALPLASLLASGKAAPDSEEVRQKRERERQRRLKEHQDCFKEAMQVLRSA